MDAFLSYVDGGGTMGDEWVARLDSEVRALNADRGWRDTMLGLALDIQEEKLEAREEGFAEGYTDGKADGYADGKADGYADGKADGYADGRAEEGETNRRLAQALIDRGRADELAQAMVDPEVKERLLAEFGIR